MLLRPRWRVGLTVNKLVALIICKPSPCSEGLGLQKNSPNDAHPAAFVAWPVGLRFNEVRRLSPAGASLVGCRPPTSPIPEPAQPAEPPEISEQVHQFCGACHAYPPPEVFPRKRWDFEVRRGFRFFKEAHLDIPAPRAEDVIRYY